MSLTASEQATINFYEWDYLGRGYYSFTEPVNIEPHYTPFQHAKIYHSECIDDGKVPSILSQISGIFKEKKPKKRHFEKPKVKADKNPYNDLTAGFSLHVKKGQEITSLVSIGFLSMISYSEAPISFEILATHESITIQIVCSQDDKLRVQSHLKAYFPFVQVKDIQTDQFPFNTNETVAICDFGLNNEVACPLATPTSYTIDPLTSIIATMNNLQYGEVALYQIIFKGATAPWAKDIQHSVSDGMGGSFFYDSPEMATNAKVKVSAPLFSCIVRIAAQGNTRGQSSYLAKQLSSSITTITTSEYNKLIPLSNKGYDFYDHLHNIYRRGSNRLGMILNANELASLVHYPNKTVFSDKFGLKGGRTKKIPKDFTHQKYILGIHHNKGQESQVTINDEDRIRHTHIIGATGTGKSTLIVNMMIEDMEQGNGCALFDPHGDIVEDILQRIPEHRKDDVIIIDASDTEFPIGFNLLHATTDAEKIVLSSDLTSAFKRHASAWGDNMTAVLSNAINTFLESKREGTLIELKRFLIEEKFRHQYLISVDDPLLHYYWTHEYPRVRKGIAPLLTRIDTFLRPKIIRYMLAQKSGIDFKTCIRDKKVILIKLSQGLIGEENSFLLGSLFLSKINQVVQGRQELDKQKRLPFYLYLDEFHNFITPSIASILSGARKYALGLIIAHQELTQINNPKILNSVISNTHIRICFRLGDNDAKRLESGFSYFEHDDLQNLGVGEAIIRVGSSDNDFNLRTKILPEIANDYSQQIIDRTRSIYAKSRDSVEQILSEALPKKTVQRNEAHNNTDNVNHKISDSETRKEIEEVKSIKQGVDFDTQKQKYLKQRKKVEEVRKHAALKNYVRTMAIQRGFKATFEEETTNGGRVDIGLVRGNIRIAVEISVTNTIDYEVKNIQKCIDDEYTFVFMLSESMIHLKNIRKRASASISKEMLERVIYITPLELSKYLESLASNENSGSTKRVKGWRVNVNYHPDDAEKNSQKSIALKLKNLLKNKK